MYNIVMNERKELIARNMPTIYQRESLVDKLYFVIPEKYNDVSFIGATALLKYTDVANVVHTEKLEEEVGLNNGYITFGFPIDTELTKFAGDILVSLTITKTNIETKKQYVLHTGKKIISVQPREDLYAFVPNESLEFVDKIVGELNAKIQAFEHIASEYDKNKADDLSYQNNKLQLISNGTPIGKPVNFANGDTPIPENSFDIIEF